MKECSMEFVIIIIIIIIINYFLFFEVLKQRNT